MANVKSLQQRLEKSGLDALLLTNDKNIYYAVGFRPTDSAALITRSGAYFVTDSRYIEAAGLACGSETELILCTRERRLTAVLKDLISSLGLVSVGAEEENLSVAEYRRMCSAFNLELKPGQSLIAGLRMVKSAWEVENITAAQRIAEKALEEVLPVIRPGVSERSVAAELTYRMLLGGAEGNSFDPIVVAGAKSSMPHGVPGDELISDGDFVTMDFGCLKNGYCSDMTRTVAVGHATEEMKNIYDTVLRAQLAGIAAARPGASGADVHNAGAKVIEDAGYGKYFGHGFGHSVGLDIHENPTASPGNSSPLPAGAVITAEPGIYIPGRFGVRIEDMILLTEGGCENLTKAPKELLVL